MRYETISSAQNQKIKTLLALQEKSRTRREKGLFVVEGRRELGHCLRSGYTVDTVFFSSGRLCAGNPELGYLLAKEDVLTFLSKVLEVEPSLLENVRTVVDLPDFLCGKVAYRGATEAVIAEVECRELSLGDLSLPANPLLIVLESVEKPGNLGAVLRSADASGADAVIICDPLTDIFNPNVIRSSIGAVFTRPVVCCRSEEAIAFFKEKDIRIFTAQLQDSEWYYDTDMTSGTAIVIGTESTGLTGIWREAADAHIKIPMLGELDSLNASVSAAILLYEAVRQRNLK